MVKRRNPKTGKIERRSYWDHKPYSPTYDMNKTKATEIKRRPKDDEGEPQPSPPS